MLSNAEDSLPVMMEIKFHYGWIYFILQKSFHLKFKSFSANKNNLLLLLIKKRIIFPYNNQFVDCS